jgi:hypothetical protein
MRKLTILAALLLAGVCAPAALGDDPKPTLEELERQWEIASGPAVKLTVRRTGWYRVGRAQLAAAGFDPAAPAQSLRLFAEGREVPMRVTGLADGRLAARGAIEFYGVGRDTASTDARTYWLTWGGDATGRRLATAQAGSRRARVARSFASTLAIERPTTYLSLAVNEQDESDHFYTALAQPGKPVTERFSVIDPDPGAGSPVLDVRVQGFTTVGHDVRVSFNGTDVGRITFTNASPARKTFVLPRQLLQEGENTVSLEVKGGNIDYVYLDWLRLSYGRLHKTRSDRLEFPLARGRQARITGFTRRRVRVVDVTNPGDPKLVPVRFVREGDSYTVVVGAVPTSRRLFAFATRHTRRPALVERNRPSAWHRAGQRADMVIISHPDFIPTLAPLVQLREEQGLRVSVVDVEQVYDEFSFGTHDVAAIKEFLLRAAENWRPGPRFVLLVGDATSDPRNYLGTGAEDYVPARFERTHYMRAPVDDWMADFDEDGVPELAIGRLPVRTAEQSAAVVAKIVGYDRRPMTAARNGLLVAGLNVGWDFEAVATNFAQVLAPFLTPQTAFQSQSAGDAAFRSSIIDVMNQGPNVVSYIGHGSNGTWAGTVFTSADARALQNADRLSFYVMTTCLNGYVVDPNRESLGESLVEAPHGGAIAVWASSALASASENLTINRELFARLYEGSAPIGEKVIAAKRAVPDSDVRRSMVLLGDPATRIQ